MHRMNQKRIENERSLLYWLTGMKKNISKANRQGNGASRWYNHLFVVDQTYDDFWLTFLMSVAISVLLVSLFSLTCIVLLLMITVLTLMVYDQKYKPHEQKVDSREKKYIAKTDGTSIQPNRNGNRNRNRNRTIDDSCITWYKNRGIDSVNDVNHDNPRLSYLKERKRFASISAADVDRMLKLHPNHSLCSRNSEDMKQPKHARSRIRKRSLSCSNLPDIVLISPKQKIKQLLAVNE